MIKQMFLKILNVVAAQPGGLTGYFGREQNTFITDAEMMVFITKAIKATVLSLPQNCMEDAFNMQTYDFTRIYN